jgi:hypothetical protein
LRTKESVAEKVADMLLQTFKLDFRTSAGIGRVQIHTLWDCLTSLMVRNSYSLLKSQKLIPRRKVKTFLGHTSTIDCGCADMQLRSIISFQSCGLL